MQHHLIAALTGLGSARGSIALVLALGFAGLLPGQSTREYDLKAVFLYHFVNFVEWPEPARPPAGEPLVVGVLGRDPFGPVLDEVMTGTVRNGNPLEVRRYRDLGSLRECHILFISASETSRMSRIIEAVRGRPILTVADSPQAAESGAIIAFSAGNRVQLHVNAGAAQRAGINISSKLLRVSTIVGRGRLP